MFLSARNESSESEDIQELINSSLRCNASTPADDMESGRGGAGAAGSTSSSPSPPVVLLSEQKARYSREEDPGRCSCGDSFFGKYSFLLLMFVTASLVILPLVLPPLPPPPSMLMLVPVAMLVMLIVLAFMPTSGGLGATTGPTAYL